MSTVVVFKSQIPVGDTPLYMSNGATSPDEAFPETEESKRKESPLQAAKKAHACDDALDWLAKPHTYKELRRKHVDWFGWAITELELPSEAQILLAKDESEYVRRGLAMNPSLKEKKC